MIKEIFGTEIKVDPKDDVKYIKKQLEEERKALEAAIRDANGVINSVRQLMTDYADYVMQNEKVAVDLHIKKVQQAIEEEDRDAVNATAKELKDYADKLAQTWDQRKQEAAEKEEAAKAELEKARNNAVSTINWVKSEMEKRKDKISQEDREILNNLINGLEGVVNGQDKNAIITKTNDLTSKANEVFAKAEPSELDSLINNRVPGQNPLYLPVVPVHIEIVHPKQFIFPYGCIFYDDIPPVKNQLGNPAVNNTCVNLPLPVPSECLSAFKNVFGVKVRNTFYTNTIA
jgi:ElaB/YqjD/DUF883 family membrane-anchored ribosome-binding protein